MALKYNKRYLEKLAKKILDGKATEAEKTFLQEYYRAFDKEPGISGEFSDQQINLLKDEIKASLAVHLDASRQKIVPLYRQTIPRIAAAASIILCLSIGGYFILNRPQPQPIAQNKTNDLAPGGNKAILTLAGGRQISLTDAKLGLLASQGSTVINKTADGEIVYKTHSVPSIGGETYNTITTPRAGKWEVTLPDNSKVWLDACSSIHFPAAFTGTNRTVEITGQAYFEVVHNAAKPFRVTCNGQTVEDIGTHFNINAYPDEPIIKTTLLAGAVKVSNNAYARILKPGQQSIIDQTHRIQVLNDANTGEAIAWKNGLFRFDNAGIAAVMRQVARWYDVDIQYEADIPQRHFSGDISRSVNASKLLEILSYTGVHFKIEAAPDGRQGKKIIVTR